MDAQDAPLPGSPRFRPPRRTAPRALIDRFGRGYGVAIAGTALAFGAWIAWHAELGTSAVALPFLAAVMLAAWVGGLRPGLLATVLATIGILALPRHAPLDALDARIYLVAALFAALGVGISLICGSLHCYRGRAAERRALADRDGSRFRELADAVPEILFVRELDGAHDYLNPRWTEVLGTTPDGADLDRWIALVHPDDRDAVRAEWRRAIDASESFRVEHRLRVADGGYRWFALRARPIADAAGRVRRWVGAIGDVHDLRAALDARSDAEARLRTERERLRLADGCKDEFLATLAHELRNPLAPMRYAMRLLQPGVPSEVADDARRIVERQLQHMARIVDDLLDVSRITRGVLELRREAIDLARVVDAAVDATRPAIESGRLALDVQVAPALPVHGDATRLAQALGNVLDNAAKYTDAGGRIEVRAHAVADGSLEVVVRDTGIGIAPEMLPRIFDLFTHAERAGSRAQGGLGIGLSFARRLVELHGGTLDAHSEGLGRGSEVVLRLPRDASVPVPASTVAPTAAPLDRGRTRVLIAEDNADAAASLAMLLDLAGFASAVAPDGQAACEMAAALRPHAIVFDIGMPKMNGLEAARYVRRQEWARDVLLIAVTGWGQEQDRQRTRDAGFDAHLTKPVDPDDLLALLAQRRCAEAATRT